MSSPKVNPERLSKNGQCKGLLYWVEMLKMLCYINSFNLQIGVIFMFLRGDVIIILGQKKKHLLVTSAIKQKHKFHWIEVDNFKDVLIQVHKCNFYHLQLLFFLLKSLILLAYSVLFYFIVYKCS